MNYRHIYHAGNFADVFKHIILARLFLSLHRKAAPFFYLDTHAGAGRYDLASVLALKSAEAREGIFRLWNAPPVPGTEDYLAAVKALNPAAELRHYPGSPEIARYFLRAQDRAVLFEQHPEDGALLRAEFSRERRVQIQIQDGFTALKALLPPKERRGLVFIDPPYESDREFDRVVEGLDQIRSRWESGMVGVWYPIKTRAPIAQFHRQLVQSATRKILSVEFSPFAEDTDFRLNGCGLVLVNPPWKLDEYCRALLPNLLQRLRQHQAARTTVTWLKSE